MKSFKKYLKENNEREEYEKNRREMLDSIHSMPLADAKTHGEMDLVSGEPIFVDSGYMARGVGINYKHAFTEFLLHPEHSNESALEHMNFLLKVAHARDHAEGDEKIYHFGNEHQSSVFDFARKHYPTLAYAMTEVAEKANKIRRRSTRAGSKMIPSKEPIQITSEHLDQINREHGVIKLRSDSNSNSGGFVNSYKKYLMTGSDAEEHIDTF